MSFHFRDWGFENDDAFIALPMQCKQEKPVFVRGQICVDESLENVYTEYNLNATEEPFDMFNPTSILDTTFVVTYTKQDGTLKTMKGTLVAPNYKGSPEDLFAYCVGLLEKSQIPVWTEQGWRSFLVQNVVSIYTQT